MTVIALYINLKVFFFFFQTTMAMQGAPSISASHNLWFFVDTISSCCSMFQDSRNFKLRKYLYQKLDLIKTQVNCVYFIFVKQYNRLKLMYSGASLEIDK